MVSFRELKKVRPLLAVKQDDKNHMQVQMMACLFYVIHYIPQVFEALKEQKDPTHFTKKIFRMLSFMNEETLKPFELKSDVLIGFLGKQASISNYFKHLMNLFELNQIDKDKMQKPLFEINLKNTHICIDCGTRTNQEDHINILKITNETDEFSQNKTVRLQIIYIYDYDKFRKYEVPLAAGEYSYFEVINKIKDKVQMDRIQIKLCKRTFCLIDLYQGNMFGQMFNDENMKFKFHEKQILTTYAYEVAKQTKRIMHRNHFIHVAQADANGNIVYHSFPRLVIYSEMDPLKTISFKVFKGMKSLIQDLTGISQVNEHLEPTMAEFNMYNQLFCSGIQNSEPYDMVIVMQDGSRWKIDTNKAQKLYQLISPDQIIRFECIFQKKFQGPNSGFESHKRQLALEIQRDSLNLKEQGFKELDQCLRHYFKANLIQSMHQQEPCRGCNQKNGLQKLVEPQKFGKYLLLEIDKLHHQNILKFPEKILLDKFMHKNNDGSKLFIPKLNSTQNQFEIITIVLHKMDPASLLEKENLMQIKQERLKSEIQSKIEDTVQQKQDGNFDSQNQFDFTFIIKPQQNDTVVSSNPRNSLSGSTLASSTTADSSNSIGRRYIVYNTCLSSKKEQEYAPQEVSEIGTPDLYQKLVARIEKEAQILVYRKIEK